MNRTITKSIKTKWISLPVDFSSRIVCTAVVPSSAVKTSTFERKPPLSFSLSISRVITLQFMSESSCHGSYRPIMLSRMFSAQGWKKDKTKRRTHVPPRAVGREGETQHVPCRRTAPFSLHRLHPCPLQQESSRKSYLKTDRHHQIRYWNRNVVYRYMKTILYRRQV